MAIAVLMAVGLDACSSSGPDADRPAPTTAPAQAGAQGGASGASGASSGSAEQTVTTWFGGIDAKNRASEQLLGQPYRNDWRSTPTTSWPSFADVGCATRTESASSAVVHCTFVESKYVGETRQTTSWDVDLTKQADGRWLITRYGVA